MIERCCFNGTRFVTSIFNLFYVAHLIWFSLSKNKYVTISANAFLDLGFIITFFYWARYGKSNMKDFKTRGPFHPGLKRFKSDHGNDCMAFYPVNKS